MRRLIRAKAMVNQTQSQGLPDAITVPILTVFNMLPIA